MIAKTKGNKTLSPAERKRMQEKARYWLFEMGRTQKEVAVLLGISANTMSRVVKRLKWREKLTKGRRIEAAGALKLKENLSGFMAYLQKKNPTAYETIEPEYRKYTSLYK